MITQNTIVELANDVNLSYPEKKETEPEWRKRVTRALQKVGAVDVFFVQESGHDCFTYRIGNQLRIVVRGTKQIEDWLSNIRTRKVDSLFKGKVHKGFDEAARVLWDRDLKESCRQAADDGLSIAIAGHSLGAATATALASLCFARGIGVSCLLAVASPRVGDKMFAAFLNDRLGNNWIRIQNNRDIVCRVPRFTSGFRHGGRMIYFDRRGEAHTNPTWIFRRFDQLAAAWRDIKKRRFFRGWVDDHSSETIAELVEQNIDQIHRDVEIRDLNTGAA